MPKDTSLRVRWQKLKQYESLLQTQKHSLRQGNIMWESSHDIMAHIITK